MLIALMTILFLGGGGGSAVLDFIADSTDEVKAVVKEDDRRDASLETMKSLEDLAKQHSSARKDVAKKMKEALAERDASADGVDEIWTGYYEQVRELNDAAVELRFELREQLTREEWERVF